MILLYKKIDVMTPDRIKNGAHPLVDMYNEFLDKAKESAPDFSRTQKTAKRMLMDYCKTYLAIPDQPFT